MVITRNKKGRKSEGGEISFNDLRSELKKMIDNEVPPEIVCRGLERIKWWLENF